MPTPPAPQPRFVIAPDGTRIATYEFGDADAETVLAVHGFASSGIGNWHLTGWTRDLLAAGFHVITIDQRGHGASAKPHDPAAYTMDLLCGDVLAVLDTFMLDEIDYLGYSLGARVGWHSAYSLPDRIRRVVLGGIPDGDPLTRFRLDLARDHIRSGTAITDRLTQTYVIMAEGIPGNDLEALVSLVDGMRGGAQPDPSNAPLQPTLFATGSEDPILDRSRALSLAVPHGTFLEIPKRNHFNAPTSREFRRGAIDFLRG